MSNGLLSENCLQSRDVTWTGPARPASASLLHECRSEFMGRSLGMAVAMFPS